MIEGWRGVVQAQAAYRRVIAAIESFTRESPRMQLPRPTGKLSADRLLFIPPGVTLDGSIVTGLLTGPAKNGKAFLDSRAPLECQSDCLAPRTGGH